MSFHFWIAQMYGRARAERSLTRDHVRGRRPRSQEFVLGMYEIVILIVFHNTQYVVSKLFFWK